ncbi:hypothetical protein G6F66_015590 [Rhizopus arrhizus]|nr:hypothetical protein G6F66_015590 [Rhizopus arrhizus]
MTTGRSPAATAGAFCAASGATTSSSGSMRWRGLHRRIVRFPGKTRRTACVRWPGPGRHGRGSCRSG